MLHDKCSYFFFGVQMGDTRMVGSFFGAGKHKPPSVLLDTRGLVSLIMGRWGLFLLIEDDFLQGKVGEGGEGSSWSDLGIGRDEVRRDGCSPYDSTEVT